MPDTTLALASLRHPAFSRALDAGHAAAAAGQWSAAAARFDDALDAAARDGRAPDAGAAVALTNLGQALARAGRWADAADALRRAAHARDALVDAGLAAPAVAARGWSDVAALLAAAGPEHEARAALARARLSLGGDADAAVVAALEETAQLVGEPVLDAMEPPNVDDAPGDPAAEAALDLDLGEPVAEAAFATDDGAGAAEPVDETVDADWRPTPVFAADDAEDDDPRDLDALLALAAGPPEPEPPAVELDGGDSLAAALDAAIEWTPTPAHAQPAVTAAHAPPATEPAIAEDDDLDAEPELLTPGVDLAALSVPSDGQRSSAGRASAGGGARGPRLAAIDAIVEMTEERQERREGRLRGLLRRLTGR